MIPFHDALLEVQQAARALRLGDEEVGLRAAHGRVLAIAIMSQVEIPRFANASMDGFAVQSVATPGNFAVVQRLAAGDVAAEERIALGQAVEIMTGAPMPPGADAVVKIEDVHVDRSDGMRIEVMEAIESGAHVRGAGEDYRVGALVAERGTWLTPEKLLAIAQTGHGRVRVKKHPRVTLIPTGRELEMPGTPLASLASVWASSSAYLVSALEALGCSVHVSAIVRDDEEAFGRAVDEALEDSDILLTTGAVSEGVHDFIPRAFEQRGARRRFHKVAVRPGKPLLFTELAGRLCFGLPGNPISTAVACRFFVWPAIATMLGLPAELPRRMPLLAPAKKPYGLRCFFKAVAQTIGVEIAQGQGSHLVRPLAESNVWAVLDEDAERLAAGTEVDVYPLQPRIGF